MYLNTRDFTHLSKAEQLIANPFLSTSLVEKYNAQCSDQSMNGQQTKFDCIKGIIVLRVFFGT